jgi:glutamate formiminotransferase
VVEEAARLGTRVRSSQLVGFIPRRAYEMYSDFFARAEHFDESRIIEVRVADLARLQ